MSRPFVNLQTHSFYSLLQASSSPKGILERAKELGCPAVGLTDTGTGHGLIEFYTQAQKLDIKPILGAEFFWARDSRFERRSGIDGNEGYFIALAKNNTGWESLLALLSKSQLEGFFEQPRVDDELIEQHKAGLIFLTGSGNGFLAKLLHQHGESTAIEHFERLLKIVGKENVYLELVARPGERFQTFNAFVLTLHKKYEVELVVSSDSHFLKEEDEEAAETLFCIGKNEKINDPAYRKVLSQNFFRSFEQMQEVLHYVDTEVLEKARLNTLSIAESVNVELDFGTNLLPQFEVPKGETEKSQLKKQCLEAINFRYGKETKEVKERLEYELSVIGKMGFEAYFLIVADFINFAKENGIAVGPGRGSAAGSIVAYLLGITNIDPIKYELLFERFLNPERISMPDIDIDFSDERRHEVMEYVIEKYGAEKVSQVCTFGTLSAKAALKDVGRVQGVPFSEMNAMTKLLPNRPGFMLADAMENKEFTQLLSSRPHLKKVFDVAEQLEGCVRHVSVHACAVIIGKSDLSKFTPLQWAPGTENVKITQLPYQQLESIGLLKMDFLGLKNLSVLEKATANIKKTTHQDLDLNAIPVDDKKTFEMMARGETTGVFQFESAGMRRYLKELIPTELEDLVAMNALYRPGPMEYIPTYIKGKHEPKKVKYMHEVLEPILNKTYGIAVYQEQILKIAQVFAGFSLGQADILRKAIGKKIASILAEQRQKFIDGAVAKGYDEKLAIKMFDDIVVPFSGYGFNRSHAVCYARIAYETAYLRANYPVEFMAAMMTADRNNTDRIVLEMNECRDMEIDVLPPSINDSGAYFTVVFDNPDQISFTGEEAKKIRFGLTAIKGLGEETVQKIIRERKEGGKFQSLQDFAKRVPTKLINKKTLEALSFSGALDEFGDRKAIVDSIDDLASFAKEHQEKSDAGQIGLFGGMDDTAIQFALKDSVAEKEDILRWERESLGLFVSDHPLKGLSEYFQKFGTPIGTLTTEDVGKKKTIHGLVTAVRKISTRTGKMMAILEIEDTSGKIEMAIFPQNFDKCPKTAFEIDAFVRVRGKVDERNGGLNMIVDEIKVGDLKGVQKNGVLQEIEDEISPFVITIPDHASKATVANLKHLLLEHKDESADAKKVSIVIHGKKVDVPFGVRYDKNLEIQVQEVLS